MLNNKILISVFLGLFLLGCGGSSSDYIIKDKGITDEKLLSCFDTLPIGDEYKTIEVFTCQGIDLSDADISELGRLPMLKKVVLNNVNLSTLEGFSTLTNLTYLDIEANYKGNKFSVIPSLDLSGISQLTKLQTLNLSKNYINDLSPLSNLSNIEILFLNEINGDKISAFDISPVDLTPLSGLEKLKKIELSGNYSTVLDYGGTGELFTSFKNRLPITDEPFTSFKNLSALSNINTLQELDVSFSYITPNLFDGFNNNIGSLTNLTKLNISENIYNYFGDKASTVTDLSFVTSLKKLKYLDLHSNIIYDVGPLVNLIELEYLDLSNNTRDYNAVLYGDAPSVYSLGDLSPLVRLTKLRKLILTNSFVTSTDLDNLQFSDLVNVIL